MWLLSQIRYLTLRPRLEASKELKKLTSHLTEIREEKFIGGFRRWEDKWSDFLKEKHYIRTEAKVIHIENYVRQDEV